MSINAIAYEVRHERNSAQEAHEAAALACLQAGDSGEGATAVILNRLKESARRLQSAMEACDACGNGGAELRFVAGTGVSAHACDDCDTEEVAEELSRVHA